MHITSLGFQTDVMIRRLSGSAIEDHGDHLVVRTPANPNFHWGNFILVLADAHDAARWLDAFHTAHPDARHVAIGLDVAGVDTALREAYARVGLELDVSDVLTARRIAEPSDDVACRSLREDTDWAQALELTLVTHDIVEPREIEFATRRQAECRRLIEAGFGTWFGAFVDGQVRATLGIVTDGSGLGRYQSVETHPQFRRRGLARSLLALAADTARRDHAVTELVIVADPGYHAIELYRSLGFSTAGIQVQVALA